MVIHFELIYLTTSLIMTLHRTPNVFFATNFLSELDIAIFGRYTERDIHISHGSVLHKPAIYLKDSESLHHAWIIMPTGKDEKTTNYRCILRQYDELPLPFKPRDSDRSCWVDWPPSAKHTYDIPLKECHVAVEIILEFLYNGNYPKREPICG